MKTYLFIGGVADGVREEVSNSVEYVTLAGPNNEPTVVGLRTPVIRSSTYRKHYVQCGTVTYGVFAEMKMDVGDVLNTLVNSYPQPN